MSYPQNCPFLSDPHMVRRDVALHWRQPLRARLITLNPTRLLVVLAIACGGVACSRTQTAVDSSKRPQPTVDFAPSVTPAEVAKLEPPVGQAFDREARQLFRIVACAGHEPIPDELTPAVNAHCEAFQPALDAYRKYRDVATPFLSALQPKNLPRNIVYPFGGGDLLSALTTYADLTKVTTLSLEHAGDPRRVAASDADSLADSLQRFRSDINGLLLQSDSTTET